MNKETASTYLVCSSSYFAVWYTMLSTKQQSGTSYTGVSTGWIWFRRAVPKVWGINAQMGSDKLNVGSDKLNVGSDKTHVGQ